MDLSLMCSMKCLIEIYVGASIEMIWSSIGNGFEYGNVKK